MLRLFCLHSNSDTLVSVSIFLLHELRGSILFFQICSSKGLFKKDAILHL